VRLQLRISALKCFTVLQIPHYGRLSRTDGVYPPRLVRRL